MFASKAFRKVIWPLLLTWLTGFLIAIIFCIIFWTDILSFHKENRGYIFSGLLTLGSFLLATKTFIITRLQDGLFQTKEYDDTYTIAIEQSDEGKVGERNQPLRNLAEFLSWGIASCLITALLQLILGVCNNITCTIVALGASLGALAIVLRGWWHLRGIIHTYLEHANRQKMK